jgi:dienelactone hydrolase
MKDRWVQTEVAALIERRLSPNPLVKIEKYSEAEHGFARTGEKAYSQPDAERAFGITLSFFQQHL